MTELYVIVKKFRARYEELYFCTFNRDSAFRVWNECIEECVHIYYDFELRKYNADNFKIIKKCDKKPIWKLRTSL